MTPEEQAIDDAFSSAAFRLGELRGRWRLIRREGAIAIISVASAPRPDGIQDYVFRFDLANYPRVAPTAMIWDDETKTSLPQDRWPAGGERIQQVFSVTFYPGTCLYLPCDRIAIANHAPAWLDDPAHVGQRWQPDRGIVFYLEVLCELLSSEDYTGRRRAA